MMTDKITEIEEKLKAHKKEITELEAALVKAKQESPDQQLARTLHTMLCGWNHTDGCGWFYEMKNKEDDWNGHEHGEYLKKANMLIRRCQKEGIEVDKVMEVYKMVKDL
jgi:hypothetical protein